MSRIGRYVSSCGLAVLCCATLGADPGLPDVRALMERVRSVQESDLRAWHRYSFRRQVVRQQLDAEGVVRDEEVLAFALVPTERAFDEQLIRIDGRPPRDSEIREHGRAARFSKHYRQARTGDSAGDDEGFSLLRLVHLRGYRVAARETVRGVPCYRVEFGAGGDAEDETLSRFSEAMAGALWVDAKSMHVMRAEARAVKPIPLSFGVVRILELSVEVDADPVDGSDWLPTRIQVASTISILGKRVRKRNTFTYTDYASVGSGLTAGP